MSIVSMDRGDRADESDGEDDDEGDNNDDCEGGDDAFTVCAKRVAPARRLSSCSRWTLATSVARQCSRFMRNRRYSLRTGVIPASPCPSTRARYRTRCVMDSESRNSEMLVLLMVVRLCLAAFVFAVILCLPVFFLGGVRNESGGGETEDGDIHASA